MANDARVIDCDGHILEPPDLWEGYLEPAYRDRALRIRVGADGFEHLLIDGRPSTIARPGQLGTLGGMGKQRGRGARTPRARDARRGRAPGRPRRPPHAGPDLSRGAAFGTMDMKERVQLLDREGMAKAVLYPTLGLLWEAELFDPELSSAYCRAYNRWIADFCRDSGGRLVPIAHLSLGDPGRGRAGARACGEGRLPWRVRVSVHDHARAPRRSAPRRRLRRRAGSRRAAGHPSDVRAASFNVHHRFDKFGWAVWYFNLFAGQGVQQAFATFFQFGVFERFPRLRVVVLESQAGWIGYFLDRADATFTGTPLGATVRLKEKPSYYFKRQCFISADPDERTIARADAPRRRGQVLLGERLPAPGSSRRVSRRAARDGGADDRVRASRDPRRERRARLPARVSAPPSTTA